MQWIQNIFWLFLCETWCFVLTMKASVTFELSIFLINKQSLCLHLLLSKFFVNYKISYVQMHRYFCNMKTLKNNITLFNDCSPLCSSIHMFLIENLEYICNLELSAVDGLCHVFANIKIFQWWCNSSKYIGDMFRLFWFPTFSVFLHTFNSRQRELIGYYYRNNIFRVLSLYLIIYYSKF